MAIFPSGPIVPIVRMARKLPIVLMVTGLPDSPITTQRSKREESESVAT